MARSAITNRILLMHMQGMRAEIEMAHQELAKRIKHLNTSLTSRADKLERKVDAGFTDVRLDIRALQEDLVATMRRQQEHEQKLAGMKR